MLVHCFNVIVPSADITKFGLKMQTQMEFYPCSVTEQLQLRDTSIPKKCFISKLCLL